MGETQNMRASASHFANKETFKWKRIISGTFFVNISMSGLSMLTTIFLTHTFRVSDFGEFTFLMSVVSLLSVFVSFGFPTFVQRQTAVWKEEARWDLLKGLLLLSTKSTILVGFVVSVGFVVVGLELPHSRGNFGVNLFLSCIILLSGAIQGIYGNYLIGLRVIVRSKLPAMLTTVTALFVLVMFSLFNAHVTLSGYLLVQALLGLLGLLMTVMLVLKHSPFDLRTVKSSSHTKSWMTSSFLFLFTNFAMIMNIKVDIVLIRILDGSAEAGIYSASTTGAQVLVLALSSIATVLQPRIASLYSRGSVTDLQLLLTKMSRLSFCISLTGAVSFVFWGHAVLRLLFGASFSFGANALVILAVARVVNAGTGALDPFLSMTGHEKVLALALISESVTNVMLNCILIPIYGLAGAAVATGGSMVVANVVLTIWTYKTTGYDVSLIGLHTRKRVRCSDKPNG